MSTHTAEVVEVRLQSHPNADRLSIIPVFGWTYVGLTEEWKNVKKGVYIPADTLVDTSRLEFSFLGKGDGGKVRIKAKRLRGVVSCGLMVPVPDDTPVGEDWWERLGLEHYEPPIPGERRNGQVYLGGEAESGPSLFTVKYDLENLQRYHHLFTPGEMVALAEKLDGCSARYVYHDGRMHCGSRTTWKREYPSFAHVNEEYLLKQGVSSERAREIIERLQNGTPRKNLWWEILEKTPELERFCRDHPDVIVHGEIFGTVNCIKYGLPEVNRFAAFDLMKDGVWLDHFEARRLASELEWVPEVTSPVGFDLELVKSLSEGFSLVKGAREKTLREGVVVCPLRERSDARLGRIKMKSINPDFLEKYR